MSCASRSGTLTAARALMGGHVLAVSRILAPVSHRGLVPIMYDPRNKPEKIVKQLRFLRIV
jgi:hypothetical protein